MSKQKDTGKAFEYSLLTVIENRLRQHGNVSTIFDESYRIAKNSYDGFALDQRELYDKHSVKAVGLLFELEPILRTAGALHRPIQLKLLSDVHGQAGDVRDILISCPSINWEIGISAKNNHRAVKHPRLSQTINFGQDWFGVSCSQGYFTEIKPIFDRLSIIRESNRDSLWKDIDNVHESIYMPILSAFVRELHRLNSHNEGLVAGKMIEYLIGRKDFYKVVKSKDVVEVQAFNIHGSLSQHSGSERPSLSITRTQLPNRILDISYKYGSETTIIVSLDRGWSIHMRIHSASSRVEPSLKFDINLEGTPTSLFSNKMLVYR
jgi:hypothetical protein